MLNIIWLGMIFLAVITAIFTGRIDQLVLAVTDSAKLGFEIALGLTGIMTFWLGMMNVASESGVVQWLARCLHPIMRPLFPDIPRNDPAMGAIVMNISANMLGLGNAATPFGIEAMKKLQRLNPCIQEASDSMCAFLAINTSSVQLFPTTAIAFLAANGATHPTSVIVSSLIATSFSTLVAILAVKYFAKMPLYRLKGAKA